LFFLEVGSRCVHFAGCTASPTGPWVVQQVRQLAWLLQDGHIWSHFLLRDRDAKFTAGFDEVFGSEGVEVIHLPTDRRGRNAFAGRWVGTARREVLDHLLKLPCQVLCVIDPGTRRFGVLGAAGSERASRARRPIGLLRSSDSAS